MVFDEVIVKGDCHVSDKLLQNNSPIFFFKSSEGFMRDLTNITYAMEPVKIRTAKSLHHEEGCVPLGRGNNPIFNSVSANLFYFSLPLLWAH